MRNYTTAKDCHGSFPGFGQSLFGVYLFLRQSWWSMSANFSAEEMAAL